MDLNLTGRVALVTGGSKGIGKAIAASLAAEGVHVAICARGAEALEETQAEIRAQGGDVITCCGDVTSSDSVAQVVEATVARFGGIDILVNNAGGPACFGRFLDLEEEEWVSAYRLNVLSIVLLVRHSLPHLRRSPAPRIINISSISGVEPGFCNPHYTSAKAASINLSKYLANEFAAEKILVNAVCPGPVASHAWEENIKWVADVRHISIDDARNAVDQEEPQKIPMGRIGTGGDVAGLVTFLASDQAAWITGSCFHVNGGKMRSMG